MSSQQPAARDRSKWILGALLVVLFAIACFWILAPWQLGKNEAINHQNEQIAQSENIPAVPVTELQPLGAPLDLANEWREVLISGHYVNEKQLQLRTRSADAERATEIVTPFEVADSSEVILVNRGFVSSSDAESGNVPAAPSSQVQIEGWLRSPEETNPQRQPRVVDGVLVGYTLDTDRLAREAGLTVADYYLQLAPHQQGSLGEIGRSEIDTGSHFSYGIQWIVFGIVTPLVFIYLGYVEIRRRRSQRQDSASM